MSKYEGTKTEQNLMTAFAGESQARNKYTFYASQARKAGYVQIANIFEETANQEKEHAKMWFKEFHGIGDVADNLKDAAAGENYEWTDMYKTMAEEAKAEGFDELAATRNATTRFWLHLKQAIHSKATLLLVGNVTTADIFTKAKRLRKYVRYVLIRELTLKEK